MLTVLDLPSTVVTSILSYLTWEEKLTLSSALPQWEDFLSSASAWTSVIFQNKPLNTANKSTFSEWKICNAVRQFRDCVAKYGKHFQNILVVFHAEPDEERLKTLVEIHNTCFSCVGFSVVNDTDWNSGEKHERKCSEEVCKILCDCDRLKKLKIKHVASSFHRNDQDVRIFKHVIDQNLSHKITELELLCSICDIRLTNWDVPKILPSLEKLSARSDILDKDSLIDLASQSLTELTLHQFPHTSEDILSSYVWETIMIKKPNFSLDLVLSNIALSINNLPKHMPLKTLVCRNVICMDNIEALLAHISHYYYSTLTTFKYRPKKSSSWIGPFEKRNQRLSSQDLFEMVINCPKLRTIHYDLPISSSSVLLIARTRRMKQIIFPDISYEHDWTQKADWSDDFVVWLKESGRYQEILQETVSGLMDKKWIADCNNKF